jgi:serine protease AprX
MSFCALKFARVTEGGNIGYQGLRWVSLLIIIALILAVPGSTLTLTSQSAQNNTYIVQGVSLPALEAAVAAVGGQVTARLDIVQGVTAELSAQALSQLHLNPAVSRITPNITVQPVAAGMQTTDTKIAPETYYPTVTGADLVWAAGVNGAGVAVAVIDSGLTPLLGLTSNAAGNPNRVVASIDLVKPSNGTLLEDPYGHGTHIAGIIANTDKTKSGQWAGMAPGVNLVNVRVLNEKGVGTYDAVIQGIQWVIANKDAYNIRVINLSLVAPVLGPYWADPLNQAVMAAWQAGIVVVAAAGNEGPGPQSVMAPGNNPYIITVGAFTDNYTPTDWSDDYIAPFSAAGPTQDGFIKPDLVAPGAHMASLMLNGAAISKAHEANRIDAQYFSMAGTSQATAVASGVAALIVAAQPDLTPDQVKFRMLATAFPWRDSDTGEALYSVWQQGAGRINAVDAALNSEAIGAANGGMNISADLDGTEHYAGYSYYDPETGVYRLYQPEDLVDEASYGTWSGSYGTWSGSYGTWSGSYGTWSGSYGTWSGSYGTWSGSYGTWSGSYGTWSGSYGTWSGSYGTWSGSYGTWSGSYGTWSGSYGTWSGSTISSCRWVNEP